MKSFFLSLIITLSIFSLSYAQDKTISGKISNEKGEALFGVIVKAENKETFTSSNENGIYEINVQEDETLSFFLEGYKEEEVLIKNLPTYDVKLTTYDVELKKDDQILKEVLVTGALGIKKKKKKLGYAIQEIKSQELNQGKPTNALNALAGKVAGVQINNSSGNLGGSTRIVIRGENSINGNNKPLIVIDGIPINNSNYNSDDVNRGVGGVDFGDVISDIDPNNIENISVLKGGAASALYGSRAINGAIIITTKKAIKNKEQIEFKTGIFFTQAYNLPPLQNQYGGGLPSNPEESSIGEFKSLKKENKKYNIIGYDLESWGPKYDPNIKYLPWHVVYLKNYKKEIPYQKPKYDVDDFFRIAPTYNTSFSFAKYFDSLSFRTYLAHLRQEGVLYNSHLEKVNFSLDVDKDFGDQLKLGTKFEYIYNKSLGRPLIGACGVGYFSDLFQASQRQLDWRELRKYHNLDGSQITPRVNFENQTSLGDGPYWMIYKNYSDTYRHNFIGNLFATYQLNPFLSIRARFMKNFYTNLVKDRKAIGSVELPFYKENQDKSDDSNYELMLNYETSFFEKILSLKSFLRINRWNSYSKGKISNSNGGLKAPNVYDLDNSKEEISSSNSLYRKRINTLSGNLNLGYKEILNLELSATNDWSSALPLKNNSYFYPAASLSWLFLKSFTTYPNWIDFGQLRISLARIGNDTYSYQVKEIFYKEKDLFLGKELHSVDTSLNNSNLKPELKKTFEVGTNLEFLKGKLNFDLTYYQSATKNQITWIGTDISTGYFHKLVNLGNITNKGIEVILGISPIKEKELNWTINFNFSKNINKVKELENLPYVRITRAAAGTLNLQSIKDYSTKELVGTDIQRDEKGRKLIDSQTGLYKVSDSRQRLGSFFPDYNLGIQNQIRYKKLDFGFLIDIQKGGKYFSISHQKGMKNGMLEATAKGGIRDKGKHMVLDGVYENGEKNKIPITAISWAKQYECIDSLNVFDANYMKLRNLSIGYTFDLSKQKNRPFKSMNISVFGSNLFVWGLAYKGADPESATNGSGNTQAIEGGGTPISRTYGVNLIWNF